MTGTLTIDDRVDAAPTVAPVDADTKMRELIGKLAKFNTKQEIAKFFLDEGVRGERTNDRECPIAKWLAVETGVKWIVGRHIVPADTSIVHPWRLVAPQVVRQFIVGFDLGEFPELATGVKTTKCECPLCSGALKLWLGVK